MSQRGHDTSSPGASRAHDIRAGLNKVWAMALGYVLISFSVAAAALSVDISGSNMLLMTTLVYAGTSQLIAIHLLAQGAPLTAIILTTFIVNLRHLLMSSSLAPHLSSLRRLQVAAFTFSLSDEAFALHASEFGRGHKPSVTEIFTINLTLHAAWIFGAAVAVACNTDAAFLVKVGLDFAPPAMFIALLALLIADNTQRAVAIMCGATSVVLTRLGAGSENVLVTTMIGATLGYVGESWTSKKSSLPSVA